MKFKNILKVSLLISLIYGNETVNATTEQQKTNVTVTYDSTAYGYWVYMHYAPCGTTVKKDSDTIGASGELFCVEPETTVDIYAWGSPQTHLLEDQMIGPNGAFIVCSGSWTGSAICKNQRE